MIRKKYEVLKFRKAFKSFFPTLFNRWGWIQILKYNRKTFYSLWCKIVFIVLVIHSVWICFIVFLYLVERKYEIMVSLFLERLRTYLTELTMIIPQPLVILCNHWYYRNEIISVTKRNIYQVFEDKRSKECIRGKQIYLLLGRPK